MATDLYNGVLDSRILYKSFWSINARVERFGSGIELLNAFGFWHVGGNSSASQLRHLFKYALKAFFQNSRNLLLHLQ